MPKMGKASKWLRNLLIGKKEEKEKKKVNSFSAESLPVLPAIPREKRRLSFGVRRSTSTDVVQHKSTRSFDTDVTTKLATQALLEYKNEKKYAEALMAATIGAARKSFAAKRETALKSGPLEHAAATKIQSVFRSYLARKALSALRGLVKLQALVRGHLVRKQTSATIRCMQALMSIQVRARIQRIQTAKEPHLDVKRTPYREFTQSKQLTREYRETIDLNINDGGRCLKSKSCHLNHLEIERIDHGVGTYSMGRLSFSNNEYQLQRHPSSSAVTDMYTTSHDKKIEGAPLTVSQKHTTKLPLASQLQVADAISDNNELEPNYMSNTESSRAKVRSQSEPKQRPKSSMKQENRQGTSTERMKQNDREDTRIQRLSPQSRHNAQKPKQWFVKIYRSTKSFRESQSDNSNEFNYGKSAIA